MMLTVQNCFFFFFVTRRPRFLKTVGIDVSPYFGAPPPLESWTGRRVGPGAGVQGETGRPVELPSLTGRWRGEVAPGSRATRPVQQTLLPGSAQPPFFGPSLGWGPPSAPRRALPSVWAWEQTWVWPWLR